MRKVREGQNSEIKKTWKLAAMDFFTSLASMDLKQS